MLELQKESFGIKTSKIEFLNKAWSRIIVLRFNFGLFKTNYVERSTIFTESYLHIYVPRGTNRKVKTEKT